MSTVPDSNLKSIFNHISESVLLTDIKGTIISFNNNSGKNVLKNINRNLEKGESIFEYIEEGRQTQFRQLFAKVLSGEPVQYDQEYTREPAENVCFQFSINPVYEQNLITGVCITGRDITKNKEAEKRLRESEYNYHSLANTLKQRNEFIERIIENIPIGIAVNSIKGGNATFMNKCFTEIYGWKEEELSDVNSFFEKVYPDETMRKNISQKIMEDIKSGDPKRMTWNGVTITTSDGEKKIVNAKNIPLYDQDIMISTVTDVTEAATHAGQMFRIKTDKEALINGIEDFIWSVDTNYCIITANNAFLKRMKIVTNKTPAEGDCVLLKDFGEDLINMWKAYYNRALGGERFIINDKVYNSVKEAMEYSVISLNPMYNEKGNIYGVACYSKDITEETQTLVALKQSEHRFRQIVETAQEGIWMIDANNQTTFVNKKMCDILGYGEEEMLGRTNISFRDTEDQQLVLQSIERRKQGISETHETNYITKSGRKIWAWVSTNPLLDDDGKYIGALAMITDITEKKLAEGKIEQEKINKQKEITNAVITAQESERSEIGREMHDNVNQLLSATRLYINTARKDEQKRDSLLNSASGFALSAIEEIRKLSKTLITPLINDIGLKDSIKDLTQEIMDVHPVKIAFTSANFMEDELNDKFKLNIFRMVQEQINNTLKHAQAKKININIEGRKEKIVISISDDGVGFDTSKKKVGVGINNIKSRSELYNGNMLLNSVPGKGTELVISFNKMDLLMTNAESDE